MRCPCICRGGGASTPDETTPINKPTKTTETEMFSISIAHSGTTDTATLLSTQKEFTSWDEEEDCSLFNWVEKLQHKLPFTWRLKGEKGNSVEVIDTKNWTTTYSECIKRTLFEKAVVKKKKNTLVIELKSNGYDSQTYTTRPPSADQPLDWEQGQVLWEKDTMAVIVPKQIFDVDGKGRHFVVVHKSMGIQDIDKDSFHQCLTVARKVMEIFSATKSCFVMGADFDGRALPGKNFSIHILNWEPPIESTQHYQDKVKRAERVDCRNISRFRADLQAKPPLI